MPISKRKLEANRRNAQKSSGPVTPIGKAKSAQNRISHGLCGKFFVLESESQEDYNDLLERFMKAEQPVDDVERELVAKMARHTWMSERAVRLQDACFLPQPRTEQEQPKATSMLRSAPTSISTFAIKQRTIALMPAPPPSLQSVKKTGS